MGENYPIPLAGASSPHTFSFTVKRSRFLTSIARARSPEEAKAFIESIRSQHADATHNCWAFVAGPPGSHCGTGEICAVVTRWFGGIKLGTGGLVRAYQDSVSGCLETLPTEILVPSAVFTLRIGYGDRDAVLRAVSQCGGRVLSEDFSESVRLSVSVPVGAADAFRAGVNAATNGGAAVECASPAI